MLYSSTSEGICDPVDGSSGHGTQVAVNNPAEADGMGEAICPVDYESAGLIIDHDSKFDSAQLTPV